MNAADIWELDLARRWNRDGLLSDQGFKAVEAAASAE